MSNTVLATALPRAQVARLTPSRIREVANAAMHRDDVIALWFGESDLATPGFVVEAAVRALRDGKTKYAHNLGLPALRAALAHYLNDVHAPRTPIDSERIAVSSSGVSALALTAQCVLDPGDAALVITPHWPNIGEIPRLLSAELRTVALRLFDARWQLDLDELLAAITPQVKAVWLNSPNNPTGWTLDRDGQRAVLRRCRELGVWLIADEVYSRLYYAGAAARPVAPSFLEIAEADDRLIVVNSFSKAWAMTGWRLGWLVTPPGWAAQLANVIEYNTSCAPPFVQLAGLAAVTQGEDFVHRSVAGYRAARDLVCEKLTPLADVIAPRPDGAFYTFLRTAREQDSMALAKRILAETGVGVAPGVAFGAAGEGHLRICFANDLQRLGTALDRIASFIGH